MPTKKTASIPTRKSVSKAKSRKIIPPRDIWRQLDKVLNKMWDHPINSILKEILAHPQAAEQMQTLFILYRMAFEDAVKQHWHQLVRMGGPRFPQSIYLQISEGTTRGQDYKETNDDQV